MGKTYDEYADAYDSWFMKNENVFVSEAKMVARALGDAPGQTLSVGCGSGLFEAYFAREYDMKISDGLEPSEAMAAIAVKRGMNVAIGEAENFSADEYYDTVLFNGCPSYIGDLGKAFHNAYGALKPGGRIVVADVPKDSAYALIYNLAMALGTWDHPLLEGVKPPDPYPIEFVKAAHWRSVQEKIDLLKEAGFRMAESWQTLTVYPDRANVAIEEPIPGHDRGSYVALVARKVVKTDAPTVERHTVGVVGGDVHNVGGHVSVKHEVDLDRYYEADVEYLAGYRAKLLAIAAQCDRAEDRFRLRDFASEGITAELEMMRRRGGDVPKSASDLPRRKYVLDRPWQVALAEILPCFTVYLKERPFPEYGEQEFRSAVSAFRRMVTDCKTRHPDHAAAMEEAIKRETEAQYEFLNKYLGLDRVCEER